MQSLWNRAALLERPPGPDKELKLYFARFSRETGILLDLDGLCFASLALAKDAVEGFDDIMSDDQTGVEPQEKHSL